MSSTLQLQKEAERNAVNTRMATVARALQGKYALVRVFDTLALIYILTADCLLTPGSERLTAFDIQVSALVYTRTSSSSFSLSSSWKEFVAYDLVAVFASPFHPSVAARQETVLAPANWINTLQYLENEANQPGRGGFESLPSIFAQEAVMQSLIRPAAPAVMSTPWSGRRESHNSGLSVPRLSVGH